nr:MAG TPA_asm: hypothetical protein [Caudoviricetes sp.]
MNALGNFFVFFRNRKKRAACSPLSLLKCFDQPNAITSTNFAVIGVSTHIPHVYA